MRNALEGVRLTVVSVKGWFSNDDTPGQLRTIYWGKKEGQKVKERQQDGREEERK